MRQGWMWGAVIAGALAVGGCEARKPVPERVPKPQTEERSNDQGHVRQLEGKPAQGTGGAGAQGR